MPSTSPYVNNDYQAVSSFRPFRLPVNDIVAANMAQNAFWEQGASRVKGVHDNALELKLSLEPNKEIRDEFIQDAEKQLTKLSAMNLADPGVQRQGMEIYKPLFKDQGIISDDAATRHIDKINNDAQGARMKENGKYYSPTNHKYALFGAKEFKNSQDRMAGKGYLENAKEFEAFYDPTSELGTILKHCKPDKASGEGQISGMLIQSHSSESLTALKINSCLDGGLSDKAKRQIQINGAVTYRDNPEALRDKYVPHLQGTRSSLSQNKAALEGVLANKDNLKNLKPEVLEKLGFKDATQITPDVLKKMQETVTSYDGRIANMDSTISKLQSGDMTDIQGSNYESVASTVFSKDYMQNISEGYSYDFTTNAIRGDASQIAIFNANQRALEGERDRNNDRWMQDRELESKAKIASLARSKEAKDNGEFNLVTKTNEEIALARQFGSSNNPLAPKIPVDNYDALTKQREELMYTRSNLNHSFDTQIGNPNKFGTDEARLFREAYVRTGRTDPTKTKMINTYLQERDDFQIIENNYRDIQEQADNRVRPLETKLIEDVQKIAPIQTAINGRIRVVKPIDIYNAIQGKPANGITIKQETSTDEDGKTYTHDQIYVDGQFSRDARILFNNVASLNGKKQQDVKKTRNEFVGKETVNQGETYTFTELNSEKEGSFKVGLANRLGIPKDAWGDLVIGETDLKGSLKVTLNPDSKKYDHNVVMKKLLADGATENSKNEMYDGNTVILRGISFLNQASKPKISEVIAQSVRFQERNATIAKSQSTPYMIGLKGNDYKMEVFKNHNGTYSYKILQDGVSSPVGFFVDREEALKQFNSLLGRVDPEIK